jgi:hypothetical protein
MITTWCATKSNTPICITEIDPCHYALELIGKMLKYEPNDRISSDDVVIQLKRIKQKVIMLYIGRGKNRRSDWSPPKCDTEIH